MAAEPSSCGTPGREATHQAPGSPLLPRASQALWAWPWKDVKGRWGLAGVAVSPRQGRLRGAPMAPVSRALRG